MTLRVRALVLAVFAVLLTSLVLGMGGCGNDKPPLLNELGNQTTPQPGTGCSVEGETGACSVELRHHDGVVDCAKGTTTCHAGTWGPCVATSSSTFSVKDPGPLTASPSSGTPGPGGSVHGLAISSTSSTCANNPCDPFCAQYPDVPDSGIDGSPTVTPVGFFPSFGYLAGTGYPPGGFLNQANDNNAVCHNSACSPTNMATATTSSLGSTTAACQEACQADSHCTGQVSCYPCNNNTQCTAAGYASCGSTGVCIASGQTSDPCTLAGLYESGGVALCDSTSHTCNGCATFGTSDKNSCQGADFTVPLPCVDTTGGRRLEVCNRGSTDVPANSSIQCLSFPGGSVQYPSTACTKDSDCPNNQSNCFQGLCVSAGNCNNCTGNGEECINDLSGVGMCVRLIDTFNEAFAAGACVTHYPTNWPSSGTESVYCNVQQTTSTSTTTTLPSAGNYAFPTSTVSAGSWTSTTQAYQVGSGNASLTFGSTAGPKAATTTANATSGWGSTANMLNSTTSDNAFATCAVGASTSSTFPASGSPSTATTVGTWTTPNNATTATADSAYASTTVTYVSGTGSGGSTDTADLPNAAAWSGLSNATGTNNATVAVGTIPAKSGSTPGKASFWMGYGTAFSGIPSGATLMKATATLYWKASNKTKVSGRVELWRSSGATQVVSSTSSGLVNPSSTTTIGSSTFTWSQADLASMTTTDLSSATLVRFYSESTDTSADTVSVDAIVLSFDYESAASLTLSSFGITVPTGSTIASVTITAGVTQSTANANGTIKMEAFDNGGTTSLGAKTVTNPGSGSTLVLVPTATLTATDLSNANFKVVLTPTTTSGSFTPQIDYVSVVVNYAASASQLIELDNFGFGTIPSTATIDTIKTEVYWKVDSTSNAETITAQPYSGSTTIGAAITDTRPPTSLTLESTTFTNDGSITPAMLADGTFFVRLRALTSGTSFTESVDYVRVTVTYTSPASSTMTLGGFGMSPPSGTTGISLTVNASWDVSTASAGTQICFEAQDSSGNALGADQCTTSGSSPPTSLTTASATFTGLTDTDVSGLQVAVTATHTAGGTPTTVNVDYVDAQATWTTTTTTSSGYPECDIQNNWSALKANPVPNCPSVTTYSDFTYTRVFSASCAYGTRPRWQLFGWNTSDPSTTSIDFRFRSYATNASGTCDTLTGVFSGTSPSPISTAESTPTDTQVCSVTQSPATTTCPANLATYLGGVPGSDLPCLQMDVDGHAVGSYTPVLNNWTVTYDCLQTE